MAVLFGVRGLRRLLVPALVSIRRSHVLTVMLAIKQSEVSRTRPQQSTCGGWFTPTASPPRRLRSVDCEPWGTTSGLPPASPHSRVFGFAKRLAHLKSEPVGLVANLLAVAVTIGFVVQSWREIVCEQSEEVVDHHFLGVCSYARTVAASAAPVMRMGQVSLPDSAPAKPLREVERLKRSGFPNRAPSRLEGSKNQALLRPVFCM